MKDGIHPNYVPARVSCACGNSFVTHSTRGDFQVDVCAACHPFYTGTQKLIDAAGRVDRFRKRYAATTKPIPAPVKPPTPKAAKTATSKPKAAPKPAEEKAQGAE
ncbi:MAG: 50S ribosomal protein L31 [Myxococcales bacterium]